jgi:hypothetical protein
VPIGIREVRSNGCRKLSEPVRREPHMIELIDVAGTSLYLGVKLCAEP